MNNSPHFRSPENPYRADKVSLPEGALYVQPRSRRQLWVLHIILKDARFTACGHYLHTQVHHDPSLSPEHRWLFTTCQACARRAKREVPA